MDLTLKDWVAVGLFVITVSGGLLTAGGLIYALKSVLHDVNVLKSDIEEVKTSLTAHSSDSDRHVNHLHMSALKENIVELKEGYKEINQKLDRIVEKLYERK